MLLFKHILALLVLSVIFVFCMPYAHQGAEWLIFAHTWVFNQLHNLFAPGQTGTIARQLITLLAIPLAAGLVPAILYGIFRRQWMSAFMCIVWTVWLLEIGVLSMAVAHSADATNMTKPTQSTAISTTAPAAAS